MTRKDIYIAPSKCVYADFLCLSHFTSFLTPQNSVVAVK